MRRITMLTSAVVLVGCVDILGGIPCQSDSDCFGDYCVQGKCQSPSYCTSDYDCTEGFLCQQGRCSNSSLPDAASTDDPCLAASEGDGYYCGQALYAEKGYLFRCQDGSTTSKVRCSNGCVMNQPDGQDACKAGQDGQNDGGSIEADGGTSEHPDGGSSLPTPTVLASGQGYCSSIATDDHNVYWLQDPEGSATVKATSKSGDTRPWSIYSGASSFAASDGFVYVTTYEAVSKVPANGGQPVTLAMNSYGSVGNGVAVTAAHVYFFSSEFTSSSEDPCWTGAGTLGDICIFSIPPAGGAPEYITSALSDRPQGMGVFGSYIYWSAGYDINRMNTQSTVTYTASNGWDSIGKLNSNGTSVFWPSGSSGGIGTVPLAGGSRSSLVQGTWVTGVAADASNIYFTYHTSNYEGGLARMPVSGGGFTVLSDQVGGDVTVDNANVYWLSDDGRILTLPK